MNDHPPVLGILFSKDRAMQLHAALRSFQLNCQDREQIRLEIIYQCSSVEAFRQYACLIEEFVDDSGIHFMKEGDFREDVLDLALSHSGIHGFRKAFLLKLAQISRQLPFFILHFYKFTSPRFILFSVDDNIWIRPFLLEDIYPVLESEQRVFGFSFRLGQNTTYCYPQDKPQRLPVFDLLSPGIMRFKWTTADGDFHYPFDVSSSIYPFPLILRLLLRTKFSNPNNLESRLAAKTIRSQKCLDHLCCYSASVAFCNPLNRVADNQMTNRAGEQYACSNEYLSQLFKEGFRVDLSMLQGMSPQSCHQEVEFHFTNEDSPADVLN